MTSAIGLAELQISPEVINKTPESVPQTLATEHNRRPRLSIFKRLFRRNPEASVTSQEEQVQLGDNLTNQIRVFDKALILLKKINDPEVLGIIAAGAIGALGIITGSSELGQAALMAGGAVVGAGVGTGPKEKIIGAVVGATAGALVSEGLHNIPVDHSAASATLSVGDDLLVPIGKGVAAGVGKIKANR